MTTTVCSRPGTARRRGRRRARRGRTARGRSGARGSRRASRACRSDAANGPIDQRERPERRRAELRTADDLQRLLVRRPRSASCSRPSPSRRPRPPARRGACASAASFAAGFSVNTGTPRRMQVRDHLEELLGRHDDDDGVELGPPRASARRRRTRSSAPNRRAAASARSRWRAQVAASWKPATGRFGRIALTACTPTPTAPTRTGAGAGIRRLVRARRRDDAALVRERSP